MVLHCSMRALCWSVFVFPLVVLCMPPVQSGTDPISLPPASLMCEICCEDFNADSKTVQCCKKTLHKYHLDCHARMRSATPSLPDTYCEHCRDINNPSIVVPTGMQKEFQELMEMYIWKQIEPKLQREKMQQNKLGKQLMRRKKQLYSFEKEWMLGRLLQHEKSLEFVQRNLRIVQESTFDAEKHVRLEVARNWLLILEEEHQWQLNRQLMLTQEALLYAQQQHRLAEWVPNQLQMLDYSQNLLHITKEQEREHDQLQQQLMQVQSNLELTPSMMSLQQCLDQLQLVYEQTQEIRKKLLERHPQFHQNVEVAQAAFRQQLHMVHWTPVLLKEFTLERINNLAAIHEQRRIAQEQQHQRQQEQIESLQRELQLETSTSLRQKNLDQRLIELQAVQTKQKQYYELRQKELVLSQESLRLHASLKDLQNHQQPRKKLQLMQQVTGCLWRQNRVVKSLTDSQMLQF